MLRLTAPRGSRNRVLACGCLVIGVGLVFTGSRGAWVGTLVAVATIVVLRRRHLLWPVASITFVVVALFLLILPPDSLAERAGFDERYSTAAVRADTWQDGIQTIAAHPVLGVGAGNFMARIDGKNFQADPNNVILLTWAETGLPGLLLLLWLVVACLRLGWRNARRRSRAQHSHRGQPDRRGHAHLRRRPRTVRRLLDPWHRIWPPSSASA